MAEENSNELDKARALLETLIRTNDRLLAEVSRLRADIKLLLERIQRRDAYEYSDKGVKKVRGKVGHTSLQEALYDPNEVHRVIKNLEMDVRQISNTLDKIEQDSISREEMKEFMIDNRRDDDI